MALPRKLKNMNLFDEGESFHGQVTEVVLPKLARKMEEFRAGGMNQPVEVDHGAEMMTLEMTCGGLMAPVIKQYGASKVDAVGLRFAGAYQREDSDAVDAVEVVVRGRWKEIDMGSAKTGEETEHKFTCSLSYYRITVNGEDLMEVDVLNMIEKIGGIDRLAEQRAAIGL